jgi:hypothetical protein
MFSWPCQTTRRKPWTRPSSNRSQHGAAGGERARVGPTDHHDPHPPKAFRLVAAVSASRPRCRALRSQVPAARKDGWLASCCRFALVKNKARNRLLFRRLCARKAPCFDNRSAYRRPNENLRRLQQRERDTDTTDFGVSVRFVPWKTGTFHFAERTGGNAPNRARLLFMFCKRDASPSKERGGCPRLFSAGKERL